MNKWKVNPLLLVKINTLVIADADNYMACDDSKNVIKCENPPNTLICIEAVNSGTSGSHLCQKVQEVIPNNNCTSEDLKQYINAKCNGKMGECFLFKRITEFSQYCEKAVKYIALYYKCGEYNS